MDRSMEAIRLPERVYTKDQVAAATQMPNGQIIAVGTRVTSTWRLFVGAVHTPRGGGGDELRECARVLLLSEAAGVNDALTSVSITGNSNNGNIVAGGTGCGGKSRW